MLLLLAILRKGTGRTLVAEVLLLTAVSTSIMFFGGLILKRPVDGLLFATRGAFDSYTTWPASNSGADDVVVLPRFPVVRDNGQGGMGYTPEMQTVEVDLVRDLDAFATDVLGDNLMAMAGSDGVILDIDTARKLGVTIGDRIVLNAYILGGDPMPALDVVGLSQPYTSIRNRGETGLVVAELQSLPADMLGGVSSLVLPDDVPVSRMYGQRGTDETTRAQLVQQFLAQLLGADVIAATVAVFGFAGMLWLASVTRMLSHLVRRVRRPMSIMFALGVGPGPLRTTVLSVIAAAAVIAVVIGGLMASELVFPTFLQSGLQWPVLVPVGAVLLLVTAIPTAVALRRIEEDLSGTRLHESLSTGGV